MNSTKTSIINHEDCSSKITLKCCKNEYCINCIYDHVQKNIREIKIKCPICNGNLKDNIIREVISECEETERDNYQLPDIAKKCLTEKCFYYMIPQNNSIIFICKFCKQPNCLACNKRHRDCSQKENKEECDNLAKYYLQEKQMTNYIAHDKEYKLLTAKVGFICDVCNEFKLPKDGYMLRCGHEYCINCFKTSCESHNYLNQLKCQKCSICFSPSEKFELIGAKRLREMSSKTILSRIYNCKTANCNGAWKRKQNSTCTKCSECSMLNCMNCEVIQENNHNCNVTQQSNESIGMNKLDKELSEKMKVTCVTCETPLIQSGGCGALCCYNCNSNVCIFTGKIVGPEGCNCTPKKLCHKDCKYGCIPG